MTTPIFVGTKPVEKNFQISPHKIVEPQSELQAPANIRRIAQIFYVEFNNTLYNAGTNGAFKTSG